MSGLFSMFPVAKFSKDRDTPLEGILGKSIRDCADNQRGRDVPLEDFYHEVLTFWQIREDVFFVRFANVDSKGAPFGNMTLVQTLLEVTVSNLRAKTHVFADEDDSIQYNHYYTPSEFEGATFLYVPDNKYVRTFVVRYRL